MKSKWNSYRWSALAASALLAATAYAQSPPLMPKPQNLRVLPKDISMPDLMTLMQQYDEQLGVECGYCHAADAESHRVNFASDARPQKATARIMMTMTSTINDKYLSGLPEGTGAKVGCGTCHRGHAMPEEFTPPAKP